MGQDESVADDLSQLMGLSQMQQSVITNWAMQEKGRALWMVGDQRYKVQTLLWAIIARSKFEDLSTEHKATAARLLAPTAVARARYAPDR